MRGALGDAGARIVLEADPTRIEPAVLAGAAAEVVLVVLDPAIEEAIDRFDSVLSDPTIEVIFEEAELALAREGWDAARWVRHLAAKLYRHADVLPPRRDDAQYAPAATPMAATSGLALA
ncbi:MAG: chemotaxis protein CheB, partial [Steroidobacteraceae bacterium]